MLTPSRRQNEFLPLVVAHLAGAGEPVDRREPFGRRRLDVAHEAVQMLDRGHHHLAQPRVGDIAPALGGEIGQVGFGHVRRFLGHRVLPEFCRRGPVCKD